jgi:hypothetical protein
MAWYLVKHRYNFTFTLHFPSYDVLYVFSSRVSTVSRWTNFLVPTLTGLYTYLILLRVFANEKCLATLTKYYVCRDD